MNSIVFKNRDGNVLGLFHARNTNHFVDAMTYVMRSCRWFEDVKIQLDYRNVNKIVPQEALIIVGEGNLMKKPQDIVNQLITNIATGAREEENIVFSSLIIPTHQFIFNEQLSFMKMFTRLSKRVPEKKLVMAAYHLEDKNQIKINLNLKKEERREVIRLILEDLNGFMDVPVQVTKRMVDEINDLSFYHGIRASKLNKHNSFDQPRKKPKRELKKFNLKPSRKKK